MFFFEMFPAENSRIDSPGTDKNYHSVKITNLSATLRITLKKHLRRRSRETKQYETVH
jgi:hypothetical protein